MKTRQTLYLALALLALNTLAPPRTVSAAPCDVPMIAQQVAVPPNVMIIFDNSGSMNEAEWHEDFDPNVQWPGHPSGYKFDPIRVYYAGSDGFRSPRSFKSGYPTSPTFYAVEGLHNQDGRYVGNYLNWLFWTATDEQRADAPRVTRQMIANTAIKAVISAASGLRYGIYKFNNTDGGTLVASCGTAVSTLESKIDSMVASGWTPTAETMVDVAEYFMRSSGGPIQYKCQKNFVILVTDGMPTKDRSFPSWMGDADGDGLDPGDCDSIGAPPNQFHVDCSHWMDDAAYYMANKDLRPDLEGDQTVTTYTIGFGIDAEMLRLTAEDGGGLYRVAWNLDTLVQELGTVVGDIVNRISSGAAVAVVSTETGTDDRLYRGKFLPGGWRGYLEAFDLPYADGDAPVWEAGRKLADRSPYSRVLFTSVNSSMVEFSTSYTDLLGLFIAPDGAGSGLDYTDGYGVDYDDDFIPDFNGANVVGPNYDEDYVRDVIEYVRGEEIAGFRERGGWKLGDLVYSTPVVVGAPASFYSELDYQEFATAYESRTPVAYVGANDGMLHAFHAESGEEIWAYLPEVTLSKLELLADPNYCHSAYVDLSPKAYEVRIAGQWRTILLCGQRTGGDSYFALDVTDPYAPDVLWETRVPTMGSSYTDPVLVRTILGNILWVGSGPNPSGEAWASAIHIDSGFVVLNTRLSSIGGMNAATAPTAYDSDFDGYVDSLYQADMAGNVYRFDLSVPNPGAWLSDVEVLYAGSEPITARPAVVLDEEMVPNIMFGTGVFVEPSDFLTTRTNRFVAVRDRGVGTSFDVSDLTDMSSNTDFPEIENGWYLRLENGGGERVTEPAVVLEGVAYFTSFKPSTSPCASGGDSWLYRVDMRGGQPVDNDHDGSIADESRSESLGSGVASRPVVNLAGEELIVQTSDARLNVEELSEAPQKVLVRAWRERYDMVQEPEVTDPEGTN